MLGYLLIILPELPSTNFYRNRIFPNNLRTYMYRKLKEQERKVKGGEEKEDMIDATEIDTEINTEGYTC